MSQQSWLALEAAARPLNVGPTARPTQ